MRPVAVHTQGADVLFRGEPECLRGRGLRRFDHRTGFAARDQPPVRRVATINESLATNAESASGCHPREASTGACINHRIRRDPGNHPAQCLRQFVIPIRTVIERTVGFHMMRDFSKGCAKIHQLAPHLHGDCLCRFARLDPSEIRPVTIPRMRPDHHARVPRTRDRLVHDRPAARVTSAGNVGGGSQVEKRLVTAAALPDVDVQVDPHARCV